MWSSGAAVPLWPSSTRVTATMDVHRQDEHFMQRALELARHGIAPGSPNPRVGAVVVTPGQKCSARVLHTYDGVKHAEILALEKAGERARGATLYINLEPCSHQGRTGPCADAVIRPASRAWSPAMQDPNPLVSGQGFAQTARGGHRGYERHLRRGSAPSSTRPLPNTSAPARRW